VGRVTSVDWGSRSLTLLSTAVLHGGRRDKISIDAGFDGIGVVSPSNDRYSDVTVWNHIRSDRVTNADNSRRNIYSRTLKRENRPGGLNFALSVQVMLPTTMRKVSFSAARLSSLRACCLPRGDRLLHRPS
jgi:hypothetical protein